MNEDLIIFITGLFDRDCEYKREKYRNLKQKELTLNAQMVLSSDSRVLEKSISEMNRDLKISHDDYLEVKHYFKEFRDIFVNGTGVMSENLIKFIGYLFIKNHLEKYDEYMKYCIVPDEYVYYLCAFDETRKAFKQDGKTAENELMETKQYYKEFLTFINSGQTKSDI